MLQPQAKAPEARQPKQHFDTPGMPGVFVSGR